MTTDVIYATGDAGITSTSGTYSAARSGNVVSVNPDGTTVAWVGQYITYGVENYLAQFDTSVVGTDAVSAVVLSVYGGTDHSTTDFTLEARLQDYGGTVEAGDWVPGANLAALTLVATFATSGYSVAGYNDFTDVAFAGNVNVSGNTRIVIASDRERLNATPTGDEDVKFYTSTQAGTANDPKLTVTHAAAGASVGNAFTGAGFW